MMAPDTLTNNPRDNMFTSLGLNLQGILNYNPFLTYPQVPFNYGNDFSSLNHMQNNQQSLSNSQINGFSTYQNSQPLQTVVQPVQTVVQPSQSILQPIPPIQTVPLSL
jgi:hypothetical protein